MLFIEFVGLLNSDEPEPDGSAGAALDQFGQVRGDHRADLGVAPGGLPVGQQDDGGARGGNLHGTEGDGIGDDVHPGLGFDGFAGQATAHPVRFRKEGVDLRGEVLQSLPGKHPVLGTGDHPQLHGIGICGRFQMFPVEIVQKVAGDGQGEFVPEGQLPALEAADLTF